MLNVIITGATGMVGKGVLLECLNSPKITSVILISRSSLGMQDPKIKEILLPDLLNIDSIKDQLGHVDGCFHCMGVSSLGMSQTDYSRLTFEVTQKLVDLCYELNPHMTFNYVSGSGTDSSEQGKQMWARVKGKAENYVLNRGFAKAYAFRPGFIVPEKGIRSRTKLYHNIYITMRPFFALLNKMKSVTTTTKVGQAMISTLSNRPYSIVHLENRDINKLSVFID